MSQYREQTSNVGNACSYASLATYNNADGLNLPGQKSADAGQQTYVVPSWGAGHGYDSLAYGPPTCSGHPNINNAYGDPNKGTKYIRYPCGGN
jgi:hypothetical protein